MTNVYIPDELFTDVIVKTTTEGKWVNGEYTEGETTERIIRVVYMPVNLNDIKNYPQGALTLEDMDLRTKENLNLGDIVIINNHKWEIIQKADYSYIADLKFYILKRSDKDDRTDNSIA